MADVDSKLDQLLALVPAVTALQETINGMQGNIAASTAAVQKIEGVAAETKVIQKEVEKQGKAIEEMKKSYQRLKLANPAPPVLVQNALMSILDNTRTRRRMTPL